MKRKTIYQKALNYKKRTNFEHKNYIWYGLVDDIMTGMNYKKFRESKKEHFITKDGRFTKDEVIKQLENWLTHRLGEPQDFFDKNEVKEDK